MRRCQSFRQKKYPNSGEGTKGTIGSGRLQILNLQAGAYRGATERSGSPVDIEPALGAGEIPAPHCHTLSRDGQFGYFCGMRKRHCGRRPVSYVRGKSLEISQRDVRAVDIFVAGLINQEKVVDAVAAADIDI